jgi:hypothetical protein
VLQPRADGSTAVAKATTVDHPVGTRIEIGLGRTLPHDSKALQWIEQANAADRGGKGYDGRSSPFWYDGPAFHELMLAYGARPVRALIAELDGCTGGKAGEIVTAAGLERMICDQINRQEALRLLKTAREHARPVYPERLGRIGSDGFPDEGLFYAGARGTVELGTVEPLAEIPFVVEVWARKAGLSVKESDPVDIRVLINRTPITAEVSAWRDADGLNLQGAGLNHYCQAAPKKVAYVLRLNLITPYCPITSDGKEPDLEPFCGHILVAISNAMRKAQRAAPKEKTVSIKDVVLDNLDDEIAAVGGDGEYKFNQRQLLYRLRPIVLEETGKELNEGNFNRIITDYEDENGEIPGMYREPRGSIYHPHRDEDIPLGTLTVEEYERPIWTFNKPLYVEKEGFSEALKDNGWPERHDCALMSSKGFTTRAARDLVDKLAEHDEPITVFCVHDADAPGTMIYQTFQEETKARGARKVTIVNLGLEPWEAVEAELEVEEVEQGDKYKPVAQYVLDLEDGDGEYWEEWLQTHRVELNAMTTPQFIDWLDQKMAEQAVGKLIPPDDVLAVQLEERLEAKVRGTVRERILREAGFEEQVADALDAIERPSSADLKTDIEQQFEDNPESEWRDHVEMTADELSKLGRS